MRWSCSIALLFVILFSSCKKDYSKEIIGFWASENATKTSYVYYIIREDGTYKKRMVDDSFGVTMDGTDRGTWVIDGSTITFNVDTYNFKKQRGRTEIYKIYQLKENHLILETESGKRFGYINTDMTE